MPNLDVRVIGGQGEAERDSQPADLYHLLSPDCFTLLFNNLNNPQQTHHSVQEVLSPWKDLLHTYSLVPAIHAAEPFQDVFGSGASVVLVRPDGYAAFTGTDESLDALAAYLGEWFPRRQHGVREMTRAE